MDMEPDAHSIPICTQEIDASFPSDASSSSENCLRVPVRDENEDNHADINAPSQVPIGNPASSSLIEPTSDTHRESLVPNQVNGCTTEVEVNTNQEENMFINDQSSKASSDGILDVGIDDPTKETDEVHDPPTETDGVDDNVLLEFLKSTKSQNHNLTYRSNLVMSFQTSKVKISPQQHFLPQLEANPLLNDLKSFYRKSITYKKNDWRSQECAVVLLNLWKLVVLQDQLAPTLIDPPAESSAVSALRSFMLPCIERAANDERSKNQAKRKRNLYRDNGRTLQDKIHRDEGTKWYSRIEPFPCPKCNHCNVIPVIPTDEFVMKVSKLEYEHKEALDKYEEELFASTHTKEGKRRKKPTMIINPPPKPSFPKEMVACMCCVTKCNNIIDGRGCHHCHALTKSNIDIPFNITAAKCECELCQCDCSISFPKGSWQNIAADIEEERLEAERQLKKSKVFTCEKGTNK